MINGLVEIGSIPGFSSLPLDNPLYHIGSNKTWIHRDCDLLTFKYRSIGEQVASLVPDIFQIDEFPIASFSVGKFGMSAVGTYYAAMQAVEVEYEGERLMLDIRQVETTTTAVAAGHPLGIPKVDGVVELDRSGGPLISAKIERPAGITLATCVFRPDAFQGEMEPNSYDRYGVRVVESMNSNGSPDMMQIIRVTSRAYGGDVWTGTGSPHFTGASIIDPLHLAPVKEIESCSFIMGGTFEVGPTPYTIDVLTKN